MEKETNTVKCPECGAEINVSDILFHQVQETLKKDFDAKNAQKDIDYKKKLQDLQNEKLQLDKDKETAQQ